MSQDPAPFGTGTAPLPDRPPSRPLRPAPGRRELALVLGLVFFLNLTLGAGLQVLSPRLGLLLTEIVFMALPAIVAVRLFYLEPRSVLPFRRPAARHLLAAAVGAASLNHLLEMYGAWQERFAPTPEWIRALFAGLLEAHSGAEFALVLLCLAFVPAICEEILFRGFVQTGVLAQTASVPVGLLVSALLFGIFHLDPWRLAGVFVLGLFFGWLRQESGSLWPPVVAHALNNALSIGLERAGWLSDSRAPGSAPSAVLAGLGIVFAIALLRRHGSRMPSDRVL
ncbi:MAG TPA: type II CAAX endopeptidase family protein [Candidatus Polarisedimenticolia bacterium]|jgi:membrane protease YdiL (CAAX protease family)|nr:type II CAAX endopeptidase family protein [Candidatus Polarisedimenticolia bacterium]